MFFFFFELFLSGVLITRFFANKLPDLFLAIASPLLGLIVYIFNFLFLLLFRIHPSIVLLTSMIGGEILLFTGLQILIRANRSSFISRLTLYYLIIGLIFGGLIWLFTRFNFSFATNDSLYIIIMAHNLLDTGLTKFYFLSPAGNGIVVAILQTIGMLFGNDYTGCIQPVISICFFGLFLYFAGRSLKQNKVKNWISIIFLVILMSILLTSKAITIFTTYIHTNFDTGVFLALAMISLLYAINEKNDAWLFFCSLFFLTFVFTRVENIIFAVVIITACLADGKIENRKIRKVFLPSLIAQLVWFYVIQSLQSNVFTDQLSPKMIKIVMVGIVLLIFMLFFVEFQTIKRIIQGNFFKIYPYLLILVFLSLLIIQWSNTVNNIKIVAQNLYFAGLWNTTWWFITIVGIYVIINGPKIPHEQFYIYLISTFITTIFLLGAFRMPYHLNFGDSANRMVAHILPIILYYLIEKIGVLLERISNPRVFDESS